MAGIKSGRFFQKKREVPQKTVSLFLALALCLALLSANAFAANNLLAGDAPLTFTASDGLVITAERLVSDNSIDFFYATEGLIAYTERSDPMLMGIWIIRETSLFRPPLT